MGKLSQDEIEEYFQKHLPYRTGVLLAHKDLCAKGDWHGTKAVLEACFEASLVTGRMYLNMLGIGKDSGDLLKDVSERIEVGYVKLLRDLEGDSRDGAGTCLRNKWGTWNLISDVREVQKLLAGE